MKDQYQELNLQYAKLLTEKYAKLGKTVQQNYQYIIRNVFVTKDQRKLLRKELLKQ